MLYEIVAGWTSPIDISLLTRGEVPTGTMSGMTAEIVFMDKDGNTIDASGDLSIQDAANWIVRLTPDTGDLVAGDTGPRNYFFRIKVTDAAGGISYFPSGKPDVLAVWPVTV